MKKKDKELVMKLVEENTEIKNTINPSTLSRVLISMIDGIVLHKGFFKINENRYSLMVEDAIDLFTTALRK